MKFPRILTLLAVVQCLLSCQAFSESVVINEVMYHPLNGDDRLQFIEIHNPTKNAVDLSGWSFTKGIKFKFNQGISIPSEGMVVVCKDLKFFQSQYGSGFVALGDFEGKMKHGGEKLELSDKNGKTVESFKFDDKAPWPESPDGYNSSLERICPASAADEPENWAGSTVISFKKPGGTPGRKNENFSPVPLPILSQINWTKPQANAPLHVTASLATKASNGVTNAILTYWTVQQAGESKPVQLPMGWTAGSTGSKEFYADIPAQKANTVVRFAIRASTSNGTSRTFPGPAEPKPAFSVFIPGPIEPAKIGQAIVWYAQQENRGNGKFGHSKQEVSKYGKGSFFHIAENGETKLYDFVDVRSRSGGWKVHFNKNQLFQEMSGINLIFEGPLRWTLSEYLSYELYRQAGVMTPKSGHLRMTVNGKQRGFYLMVEQPNKTFLARNKRDENGNLYKLIWYGRGLEEQHEKKSNIESGHQDLKKLIQDLNNSSGAAQWQIITNQFNLDNIINYFAVNMCIQNWDGFFNNYFAYHDIRKDGKWEMIPWDEDKTWGEYDGCSEDYDWYEMPLTMGMRGDSAPMAFMNRGPFGGPPWWRPGGYFSNPILANPEFRRRMSARLEELCNTVFTEEKFGKEITALEARLKPEIIVRAKLKGQNPDDGLREFNGDIESYHNQIKNRRKFILSHLK